MIVRAHGLRELRKALRDIDRGLLKELRQLHREVGDLVADRAKAATPPRTRRSIRGKGTQAKALVRITPGRGDVLARFMGAKRRSGWYARRRYRGSENRQFKPWVGNQWDPGEAAGKPYHIGDAINDSVDEVVDLYGDLVDDSARRNGLI